jgi:hypothetical protein
MPIYRRLPKRGFTPLAQKEERGILNVQDLQRLVDAGKLKAKDTVTLASLQACGAVRSSVTVLRLLGKGKISVALKVEVDYATASASRALVAAGGTFSGVTSQKEVKASSAKTRPSAPRKQAQAAPEKAAKAQPAVSRESGKATKAQSPASKETSKSAVSARKKSSQSPSSVAKTSKGKPSSQSPSSVKSAGANNKRSRKKEETP